MAHVCLECGNSIPDGSDKLLEGCPECGENIFTYSDETENMEEDEVPSIADIATGMQTQVADKSEDEESSTAPLRDELEDQYEGIRVESEGEYRLNLRAMYETDQRVIHLIDEGIYEVHIPDSQG